jgi:hypothetical protein
MSNLKYIEGFEDSDYKTPSQIGTVYNLLNINTGFIIQLDECLVTIEQKSGTKIYSSKDYGYNFDVINFTIEEGENKITYTYKSITGAPTYGYQSFTIYGVENKYPLKPWTVSDVIQRVLQLVEPIRLTKTPRFSFKPPTDSKARLFSQFAPEFTFTRMTLREALQTIGGFIHAEPRLTENNEIVWDFYGEQGYAELYNPRTKETKRLSETRYRTLQSSFGVDQACTKLDSYQQNLVNRVAWEQGTTVQPYKGGEQTLRTETAYIRAEESPSFFFPTQQGVDRVVKFEYISEEKDENGKYKTFDITPYVFEEKVYNALSSYEGGYPKAKAYALYYTQSGKGINGFFFKTPDAVASGAFKNYSIVNILEKSGAKIPKEGDENAYEKLRFRLSYVPIYSTRVQQSKPYLDEYLPLPRVLNYTQTDNSVETRFFGENIKGAVSRMGNPEKTYTINLRNLNNIPKAGQLWDNDYYIASVSVAVNQDIFEVSIGLSKNFNRKSQYIGASSIKRIYEVSEEMVQQRHTVYTDYIVLTKELYIDSSFVNAGLFLEESGVKAISYIFTSELYSTVSEISSVYARGRTKQKVLQEAVLLPVVASSFGNVIEFTWEYKDNFSAGIQSVNPTSETITGVFGKEVEYTDYYGRLYSYSFALMSEEQVNEVALPPDPSSLPGTSGFRPGKHYAGALLNEILERKDSRESLKKSYAVEFVTDEPTFIIGSAFAGKNPLVYRDPLTWQPPKLYIFPKRLNKFASHIDFEGAKELDWDNSPTYSEYPVPHFSITGKTATASGQAWAYVIPQSTKEVIVEDEDGSVATIFIPKGGELIIGENIDIIEGKTVVGAFKGLAIHDVFKYLEEKNKVKE